MTVLFDTCVCVCVSSVAFAQHSGLLTLASACENKNHWYFHVGENEGSFTDQSRRVVDDSVRPSSSDEVERARADHAAYVKDLSDKFSKARELDEAARGPDAPRVRARAYREVVRTRCRCRRCRYRAPP